MIHRPTTCLAPVRVSNRSQLASAARRRSNVCSIETDPSTDHHRRAISHTRSQRRWTIWLTFKLYTRCACRASERAVYARAGLEVRPGLPQVSTDRRRASNWPSAAGPPENLR